MHTLLVTLICIALVGGTAGCEAPSGTPAPTATASDSALAPTPTVPAPTSTVAAGDPPASDPTPTAQPDDTPTAVTSATDRPAPTPAPAAVQAAALKAASDGDWERAQALWQNAIDAATPAARPALLVARARTLVQAGRPAEGIAPLNEALEASPDTETAAEAWGLLGSAYQERGEWQAALDAYAQHLALDSAAEPYVRWQMGRCYDALGDPARRAEQLGAVALADLPAATQAEILEERAEALRTLGRYDEALACYDAILGVSKIANYIALVQHMRAETLHDAGRDGEAVPIWLGVARNSASSSAAALALAALDALGEAKPLDGLARGEILYHAGQYNAALGTLRDHVRNAGGALDRAHYYAGLCQTRLGAYPAAYAEFDAVIEDYPASALLSDAWFAKARAAAAAGGESAGLYLEYAVRYPDSSSAAEAIWLAASTLEQARDWTEAGRAYQRLHTGYPAHSRAPEARFREGLAGYALGDVAAAYTIWSAALEDSASAGERARLHTWLGLAATDAALAQTHWQAGAEAAPESYYGLRARDLAAGRTPVLSAQVQSTVPDGALTPADWQSLTEWIAGWHSTVQEPLIQAEPLRRAETLLRLDWRAEALATLAAQRDAARSDPAALLALARYANERQLYGEAIQCAERILVLGRATQAGAPPEALLRLAYPTAYGDLISEQAATYSVDALLFLALVRQESRFDARAVSYAGASGLTQVMPATGLDIAARLHDDDYEQERLFWPVVSVRYGVWYLSWLLDLCERDWVAALISYNAGYGRLRQWTGEGPIRDHDLLYETMTVEQPRAYVRRIYEGYAQYRALYER